MKAKFNFPAIIMILIAVGTIYYSETIGSGLTILIVVLCILLTVMFGIWDIFKIHPCPDCQVYMEKTPKDKIFPEFDHCIHCDKYYKLWSEYESDSPP